MTELSPVQVELQYVDAMGNELGRMFYRLHCERASLHLKWKEYVRLFGTDVECVNLLNEAAPAFFSIIEDTLWDDVILHICRLTEGTGPPGKKERLTLQCLPPLIAASIYSDVERHLAVVASTTVFAWDWRDRRIGHSNRQMALGENARPLKDASRQAVNDALEAIDGVLCVVERHYCGVSAAPFDVIGAPGDANSLLYVIREGLENRKRRFSERT